MVTDHYPAARFDDRSEPEWPPDPGRVFCALVASHQDDQDLDALRELERLAAPRVHVAAQVGQTRRASYVVTNRREARGGHQVHPARTALERSWRGTVAPGRFVLVWDDAPDDLAPRLDRIAARVPYLGRSTGVALVSASTSASTEGLDEVHEPCDLVDSDLDLRVPYPGYLEDLQSLHAAGRPSWEAARTLGYRSRHGAELGLTDEAREDTAWPPVFPDLVVLRFDGYKPAGRLLPLLTRALRNRLMRLVPDPLPPALHGHGENGMPHIAFLGLPVVGSAHSDGHLLGMAIALPLMPTGDRDVVVRALHSELDRGRDLFELDVDGVGRIELITHDPVVYRVRALDMRHWGGTSGARAGSSHWVTATPVVLDRFPRGGDVLSEIARTCERAGLPRPVHVESQTRPLVPGAVDLRPADLPTHLRGRLYRHARVVFPTRVQGPVLAGAGRYCGLGLFTPLPEHEGPRAHETGRA